MAFKFNPFTSNFDEVNTSAGGGTGDVTGPVSSTDEAIARFDGATGKIIQNSSVTISDTGDMVVAGDLTVNGTTTTINTATLDVEDQNITVNINGNDASAEGAGLTINRTGTDGSFVYEDALTSKFKLGALGSEIEIANISGAQTLTNKTIAAGSNTITDLANANISASAVIVFTKMEALNTNRVNITNGSGFITTSTVTDTELGHLSGVSSAIQTQLNAKLDDIVSSTDDALVRWDGIAGEAVQNSLVTLSDAGVMAGITQLSVDNLQLDGNTLISTNVDGNITLDPNGVGIVDVESELSVSSNKIVDLAAPTAATDAVNKTYFETNIYSTNNNSGVFSATNFETHLVDTSGGVATVTLPAASTDAFIVIKDKSGNANTNNITINTPGAETIDGAANLVVDSNFSSTILVSDGTNWFIL